VVAKGSTWRWYYLQPAPPASWNQPGFNASSWPTGPAVLGWGSPNVVTSLDLYPNTQDRPRAAYFRHTFSLTDVGSISRLQLRSRADDGVVIYVNGVEVVRENMRDGDVTHMTYAPTARREHVALADPVLVDVPLHLLVEGQNVVTARTHQNFRATPDTAMRGMPDAELDELVAAGWAFTELFAQPVDEPTRKPATGTYIIDIRELDNPVFVERFEHDTVSLDHNFIVKDDKIYQANYTSGTRVLQIERDADGMVSLSPFGHTDTEPRLPKNVLNLNQEDKFGTAFLGQWGVFPLFDSGTIVASDRNNGLIIMRLSDEPCKGMKCSR
jgi:hypothetical protein